MLVDDGADFRRSGVDESSVGGDLNCFRNVAGLEGQVERRVLADGEADTGLHGLLEALVFDGDLVLT